MLTVQPNESEHEVGLMDLKRGLLCFLLVAFILVFPIPSMMFDRYDWAMLVDDLCILIRYDLGGNNA